MSSRQPGDVLNRIAPQPDGSEMLLFRCPGCGWTHGATIGPGEGPRWTWNGDVQKPIFSPSLLVRWTEPANLGDAELMRRDVAEYLERSQTEPDFRMQQRDRVCHSFIGCNGAQPGEIIFLSDCTHALAGQIVPLTPFSW